MTTHDVETVTGAITLVGIGVCVAALVTLHLLPTGLSPLRNPVSQYGITRFRTGYRIQTIAMGIAAIAAAIGIAKVDIPGCTVVVVLLAVCGASRLIISWYPMDDPLKARTETGRRHGGLAILAFGGAILAAVRLGAVAGRAGIWGGTSTVVTALGFVMLASLVAMGAVRRNAARTQYFGLAERGFYLGAIAFFVVIGAELITAS